MKRAAAREFRILQSFDHPGILDARDYKDHEFGPALLFAYEPGAMRLDHYLATRGPKLTARHAAGAAPPGRRRRPLRPLQAGHPPGAGAAERPGHGPRRRGPPAQGLQLAGRRPRGRGRLQRHGPRPGAGRSPGHRLHGPRGAARTRKAATEASDVFSLGAIAYHLFAGRPPGESPAEVARMLGEHKGLKVSAVLDGAGPELEELIRWSTDPDVDLRDRHRVGLPQAARRRRGRADRPRRRTASSTRPAGPAGRPPGGRLRGRAGPGPGGDGDRPAGPAGRRGVRAQGRPRRPRTTPGSARRPRRSGTLRSEFIVGLHEVREIGGRTVLVLDKSGDETLAERLRKEGRLGLELLQRFGEDLLQAVASLERHGVAHRDIKPDNIGVRSGKQRLQLILFDFSLSRAPAEQIQVGTHPYLDPFLSRRRPPRWDLAAERYAAGVTLYEMAAGVLPRWGDGKSDPALTDDRAVGRGRAVRPGGPRRPGGLLPQGAGPRPRAAVRQRRGDAPGLARGVPPGRAADGHHARRRARSRSGVELDQADPETLVAILGLSTRATNALDRVGRDDRPPAPRPAGRRRPVHAGRRQEDARRDHRGARPPPEAVPEAAGRRAAGGSPDARTRRSGDARPRRPAAQAARARRRARRPTRRSKIRELFLGLVRRAGTGRASPRSSARLDVTRQRIGQVVGADRERWAREPAVTALRAELLRTVQAAGGVMALPELADALAAARGTAVEGPGRPPAPGLGPGAAGVRDRAGDGQPPPAPAAGRPGRAAGLHARAGRVRRAAGPGGRRDRGREPAAAAAAGLPAALRGRAARVPARVRAAEQRADHPPGRRRQRPRRRLVPAGTLPPGHGRPPRPAPRPGGVDRPGGQRPRPQGRAVRPPGHPRADRRPLPRGRAAARPARAGRPAPRGRPRRDLGRDDDHVPAAGRVAARHVGFLAAADHRVRLVARVEAAAQGGDPRGGRGAASSTSGCGTRSATARSSS